MLKSVVVLLQPSPTTLDEIFKNIFTYIDRLFGMVRPRKLMYMAIGKYPMQGVAGSSQSCT